MSHTQDMVMITPAIYLEISKGEMKVFVNKYFFKF